MSSYESKAGNRAVPPGTFLMRQTTVQSHWGFLLMRWFKLTAFMMFLHLPGQLCYAQTPASAPHEVDLAEISKDRSQWPKEVSLLESAEFPIIIAGRESGKIAVPKGAKVKLIELMDSQVKVAFNGAMKVIPATSTDLVELIFIAKQSGAQETTLPTQTAIATESQPVASASQATQKPPIKSAEATASDKPVTSPVRLIILSSETAFKHDGKNGPIEFSSKNKIAAGFGTLGFKSELENLTTSPLKNVRLVITVLDKTTTVDKQGNTRYGNLSVQYLKGGRTLDPGKRAQYSADVMVSFDEKSKLHPVEAYSVDVFSNRQLLLTQTYPPTAQKMMDEKKSGSDDYKKWSGVTGKGGATGSKHMH